MTISVLAVRVRTEHDVVLARQRARQLAEILGLAPTDQTRAATAVSEIARNAFQYAGGGRVDFQVAPEAPGELQVRVTDRGPGIPNLEAILSGSYRSREGLGLGILGARRLMDRCEIRSTPGEGTSILLGLRLGAKEDLEKKSLLQATDVLAQQIDDSPFAEVLQQNQELLLVQADLADANRRLAEADARKDRFMAMLGHELRNQLSALKSALEVLQRNPDPRTRQEMQRVGRQQALHIGRLVDDLLDASTISRGQLNLKLEVLDLRREVEEVAASVRAELEEAGLALDLEVPAEPVPAEVDSTRFAQIVTNLLSNARKFTDPGGTVCVRLALEEGAAAGDSERSGPGRVRLEVEDTGCGVDEEGLARILQPFYQTEEAQRRMTGGLGLGLSIVKGLVEVHGGQLQVVSEGPGKGTTFTAFLPISAKEMRPEKEAGDLGSRASAAASSSSSEGSEPGRLRILVVDDYEPSAMTLAQILSLEGHETKVATDGEEALEAAESFRPQLVFCDLGLPGMNGYEVARHLRSRPATAQVPLYALSGFADEEARQKALEAGFNRHLVKPLSIPELQEVLYLHGGSAEPSPL